MDVLKYVVRPQSAMIKKKKLYLSRKILKEEKRVNEMSIFQRRKKEILVSLKHSARKVTKINHQNDQFAIT